MLIHSFPVKNESGLVCDIMYTSATHAGNIHDITDFVKMAVLTAVYLEL